VLNWKDFDWSLVTHQTCESEYCGQIGPYVPVEWNGEESCSLVPVDHIIDSLVPLENSTVEEFITAQNILARHCIYISYSIPPETFVLAKRWENEHCSYKYYRVRVVAWKNVPWNDAVNDGNWDQSSEHAIGPYIPVEWEDEQMFSIIPLIHIIGLKSHSSESDEDEQVYHSKL